MVLNKYTDQKQHAQCEITTAARSHVCKMCHISFKSVMIPLGQGWMIHASACVYMWQCKCKPNANVKEQNKCSYISIIKFLKFFWHCFLWKDADSLIILLRQHSYLIVESIQFLMCKFYSYFLSSLKDKIKMIIEWGLQIYL